MVAALDALPAQHGAFVSNCPAHCQTGSGFDTRTVNGTLMKDAFVTWFKNTLTGGTSQQRWIARCDVEPCGSDQC